MLPVDSIPKKKSKTRVVSAEPQKRRKNKTTEEKDETAIAGKVNLDIHHNNDVDEENLTTLKIILGLLPPIKNARNELN